MYPSPYSHARDFEHIVMGNYLEISKLGIPGKKGQSHGQGQGSKPTIQFSTPNIQPNGEAVQHAVANYLNGKRNDSEISMGQYIPDKSSFCSNRKWWWDPPKDSVPKDFFLESSMHGKRY